MLMRKVCMGRSVPFVSNRSTSSPNPSRSFLPCNHCRVASSYSLPAMMARHSPFRRVYAVKSQIEHQYAFFHIYRGVEHRIEPGFLLRFKNTGQYEVVIGMVSQCVNGKNNIHELVGDSGETSGISSSILSLSSQPPVISRKPPASKKYIK